MKRLSLVGSRQAALFLLLTGVLSGRATITTPFDSFSTIERVVAHPSYFLEDGVYAIGEIHRKGPLLIRRRMVPLADDPFQGNAFKFKGSDVARTISDSGGSLQLLLLLLLCAAVLCCASMSISPWYKSESYILRKAFGMLYAATAFLSDRSSRAAHSLGSTEGRFERPQKQSPLAKASPQTDKALRKAKSKRRKGAPSVFVGTSAPTYQGRRPLEKATSSGNSSTYDLSSLHSGETELELAPREDREIVTPADLQIARIEAEALRQSSQRAAKSKLSLKKQVEQPQEEKAAVKPSQEATAEDAARRSERPLSQQGSDKSDNFRLKRTGPKELSGSRSSHAPRSVPAEEDGRDRLGRKMVGSDKQSARLSQVLVVPRRPPGRGRDRVQGRQAVSDDEQDAPIAPRTPERSNPNDPSPPSLHSNLFSPSLPSRLYAQVAKENSYGQSRVSAPPPPPPPPPARMGAIPQTAVFAREFRPATQSPKSVLNASAPAFSPGRSPVLPPPPPAHVAYLQIQSPERPPCPTSSPLPSPFPGMSLHRRLVPPSPQQTSRVEEDPGNTASGSNQSSSALFKGLGFPGVFDTIWSTRAVAGETSWALNTGSVGSGRALAVSVDDDFDPPVAARQDSW